MATLEIVPTIINFPAYYSTIRDIVANENSDIHVQSIGGAKTGDILNTLKRTKRGAFSDIIIHVGTNDTATKFPKEKIVENITNIIDQAKEKNRPRDMLLWVAFVPGPIIPLLLQRDQTSMKQLNPLLVTKTVSSLTIRKVSSRKVEKSSETFYLLTAYTYQHSTRNSQTNETRWSVGTHRRETRH